MSDRPIYWLGSSHRDLKAFPSNARRVAGFQLRRVQQDPNDWKPMPGIGPGVREIRIHTGLEHRVLYVARFAEGVYVLHAYEKRTRKTSAHDLNLARDRFRALGTAKRPEDVTKR